MGKVERIQKISKIYGEEKWNDLRPFVICLVMQQPKMIGPLFRADCKPNQSTPLLQKFTSPRYKILIMKNILYPNRMSFICLKSSTVVGKGILKKTSCPEIEVAMGWSDGFKFRFELGQFDSVRLLGYGFGRIILGSGSGRLSDHLVSNYFRFWVVSG
jgi:hypothetical protein